MNALTIDRAQQARADGMRDGCHGHALMTWPWDDAGPLEAAYRDGYSHGTAVRTQHWSTPTVREVTP